MRGYTHNTNNSGNILNHEFFYLVLKMNTVKLNHLIFFICIGFKHENSIIWIKDQKIWKKYVLNNMYDVHWGNIFVKCYQLSKHE